MKQNKWTTSQKLQFAAFAVAATRFMAMGAMALGVDLVKLQIFGIAIFFWLEVLSWLGFAVLEGYAVPYLAKGTRKLVDISERRRVIIYRYIILSAIPLLGAPYYVAMSANKSILLVLGDVYWAWAFLLCGVSALIIDAVGTVEGANEEAQPDATPVIAAKSNEATALEWIAKHGPTDPGSLAENAEVPIETAIRVLGDLRSAFVVSEPVKVKRNGNGNGVAK